MLRTVTADGLREAVDGYAQAQDELVEARNRLAHAIAGAAMSGLTQDEIADLTGGPSPGVIRSFPSGDAGWVMSGLAGYRPGSGGQVKGVSHAST
jgi:hypothetical protein